MIGQDFEALEYDSAVEISQDHITEEEVTEETVEPEATEEEIVTEESSQEDLVTEESSQHSVTPYSIVPFYERMSIRNCDKYFSRIIGD